MSNTSLSILAASALAVACAILSIVVVLRRWTFAGEGIGHSAFGGAGTAWLLALLVPALDRPWVPYVAVVIFCIATALLIGRASRGQRISSDAAVGVFLVASIAWGFLAQQIYTYNRPNRQPPAFEALLFGRMGDVSIEFALASLAISAAVILTIALLGKEILAYCFDPQTARTSGVPTDFLHDLLMVLLALVIVIGARIVGSVLVIALLVLPGATALMVSRNLKHVVMVSTTAALIASIVGVAVSLRWRFIPSGPAIVLTLFALFALAAVLVRPARAAESVS